VNDNGFQFPPYQPPIYGEAQLLHLPDHPLEIKIPTSIAKVHFNRPLEEQSINTIKFICVHLCLSVVKNQKLAFLPEV